MEKNENYTTDIKPEIVFIPDLLKEMRQGSLRVPRFQRPFVWSPEKILNLLDSVLRRYPIGSLLLWDTPEKMASTSRVGPIFIGDAPDGVVTYILDGQQRLTSLFGVLMYNDDAEDNWVWKVWFDLERKEFVHLKKNDPQTFHFPLGSLLNTYDFLQASNDILQQDPSRAKYYLREAQELADVFKNFKVPITRIQNTPLDQAVRIFSRLNSSGVKVSDDQMISALVYRESSGETAFSLSDEIDSMLDHLASLDFGNIDRTFVLKAILTQLGFDVYKTNWEKMVDRRGKDLPAAIEQTRIALTETIKFLKSVGIFNDSLLPYTMQLVVLSAFFGECDVLTDDTRILLERWFWVSSYTGWFATSNSTHTRRVISDMKRIAKGKENSFKSIDLDDSAAPFPLSHDFRSARVRLLILFLLSFEPLDLDGSILPTWELLAKNGHRSLRNIFKQDGTVEPKLFSNSVNRTFFPYTQRKITELLTDMGDEDRHLILQSHGIPPESFSLLQRQDADAFLKARLDFLQEKELIFIQSKNVTAPISEFGETVNDSFED